jgi:hypothetical protein
MEILKFDAASIKGITWEMKNAQLCGKLNVIAAFTKAQAEAMGIRWMVTDSQNDIRDGFDTIGLKYQMRGFKFNLAIPQLDADLTLHSEVAEKFVVKRKGDGKKKQTKLILDFKVAYMGNPQNILDWMVRVANQPGKLTMTPDQTELPFTAAEAKKGGKAKPEPIQTPIPGETFQ